MADIAKHPIAATVRADDRRCRLSSRYRHWVLTKRRNRLRHKGAVARGRVRRGRFQSATGARAGSGLNHHVSARRAAVARAARSCAGVKNAARASQRSSLHVGLACDVLRNARGEACPTCAFDGDEVGRVHYMLAQLNRRNVDVTEASCKTHARVRNCLDGLDVPVATVHMRKSPGANVRHGSGSSPAASPD